MNELETLQNRKTTIQGEINNLTERRKEIDIELSSLKSHIGTNKEPRDSQSKIRDLVTDRNILDEVIKDRTASVEELNQQLDPLLMQAQIEENKKELIKIAEDATKASEKFFSKRSELDQVMVQFVLEIIQSRIEWEKQASNFMNLADKIAKGFTASSERKSTPEDDRKAEELINELSAKINLDAAMSSYVLETRYFPKNRSLKNDKELFFGHAIESLMRTQIGKLKDQQTS